MSLMHCPICLALAVLSVLRSGALVALLVQRWPIRRLSPALASGLPARLC